MTKVLLITGTPGTGKTTLTSLFAQNGYITFNLYDVADGLGCTDGFDQERNAIIIDDDCLFDNIGSFIRDTESDVIILEGHYADVVPKEYLFHCIVLSPSIDTLRPRLVDRGYDEIKIMENIEAHIMKECYYDALEYYGEAKVTEYGEMELTKLFESIQENLEFSS